MVRLFLVTLPAATGDIIYRCKHCDTHLAYATDIISKVFYSWFISSSFPVADEKLISSSLSSSSSYNDN